MKNKTIGLMLMAFCLMISPFDDVVPQSRKAQAPPKRFNLKNEPGLGMRLPFKRRSASLLMTSSGSLEPSFEVGYKGLEFTVCADKDMLITYVSSHDSRFRTPEGIALGESLKSVLEISKGELVRERGWAFFVSLNSGWSAAFVQGDSMTEGVLPADAKVRFLFKR